MSLIDCKDWAYDLLVENGLAERVRQELFDTKRFRNDYDRAFFNYRDCTAHATRALGKRIARVLSLPTDETYCFDTLNGLYLALGAYFIGEHPDTIGTMWRSNGRKAVVWNLNGEGAIIRQKDTDSIDDIFVPDDQERHLRTTCFYWPHLLGLALVYFHRTHPQADLQRFVQEHFIMWKTPIDKYLFADNLTTEEIVERFVPPPGFENFSSEAPQLKKPPEARSRGGSEVPLLREVLTDFVPDVSQGPVKTIYLGDNERTYAPFLFNGDLHFGIHPDDLWPSEYDAPPPEHLFEAEMFGCKHPIRDWIKFTPDDAPHFLKACLEQYTRDRAQVPEIVDFYLWGLSLENP